MDPMTLQELLDELAREGGNLTEFLATQVASGRLTIEAADELANEALDAFSAIQNAETRTAADVATLTTLVEATEAVRAARQGLVEAAEAEAAQIAELATRIAPPTATDAPAEGGEGGEDAPAEGDGTPADDAPEGGEDAPTGDPIADAPVVDLTDTPEDALVASNRTRPHVNLAAIARRAPRVTPEQVPNDASNLVLGGALVASATAPGARGGSTFESWNDVVSVVQRGFSASPSSLLASVQQAERVGQSFYQRNSLFELRTQFPEDLIFDSTGDATEVLARAADQSRLPGGSLLAAGGWCSPSEQLYDLCDLPCTFDGILSLPEVLASRGGLKWIKTLDWCDIFNAPGFFHFTEAEMMAEPRPDKPCMEIPCPDEDECRLDVDGLCITADIMMRRTFPEVIAQFIQGALCAHAHRINANKINQIVTGSPSIGTIGQAGYGATNNILYAIEMQIQAYRYRGRRAQDANPALLELVAPYWIKAIIRADIANRNAPSGIGNPQAVTDAEIVQWFATRGVAVRFVYDWQDLTGCPVPPATTVPPITDYPNSVEFILYEAGTWVVPSLDVITLETLYDSALIKQNKFQALFTEQAFCVINRCNDSIRFSVDICANGNTGAQVAVACA